MIQLAFVSASDVPGDVAAAIDINTTAIQVYRHNYPETNLLNNNIQKFTAKAINKMNVNCILMSPPCQPFTRVGNKKDIDDARTNALLHICRILDQLVSIEYILMENVKGFETSQARNLYVETLEAMHFEYQEFILTPTEIGVPNTRHRYYCLARRKPFSFKSERILTRLPGSTEAETPRTSISDFLDDSSDVSAYLLSDEVLSKRAWLLDIVHPTSANSMCFTKAYTHYTEGTGSVYCPHSKLLLDEVFAAIKDDSLSADEKLARLKGLELRYFTPTEVARLMSFPPTFSFPSQTSDRQKYRVLGNSINVAVVGKLIRLLVLD